MPGPEPRTKRNCVREPCSQRSPAWRRYGRGARSPQKTSRPGRSFLGCRGTRPPESARACSECLGRPYCDAWEPIRPSSGRVWIVGPICPGPRRNPHDETEPIGNSAPASQTAQAPCQRLQASLQRGDRTQRVHRLVCPRGCRGRARGGFFYSRRGGEAQPREPWSFQKTSSVFKSFSKAHYARIVKSPLISALPAAI